VAGFYLNTIEAKADDVQTIDVVVEGEEDQHAVPRSALDVNAYDGLWTANPQSMLQEMHEDMRKMEERMQSVFNDPFFTGINGTTTFAPPVLDNEGSNYRYEEVDGKIVLTCKVDGAVDSTIDIDVRDGIVAIQGMKDSFRNDQQQGQFGDAAVFSSSRSQFYRSFPLSAEADPDRYKVEVNDDMITIIFDKKT